MNINAESVHISVMPDEVLRALNAEKGGDFLDCTLGGAGHTLKILQANPNNNIIACDRDPYAISRAEAKLSGYNGRFKLVNAAFSEVSQAVDGRKFDGLLADLGLSTDQLFENRGFSFRDDSPLDMRMNPQAVLSADQVVNHYSEKELISVFKRGGASGQARFYARAIIKARPVKSTSELAAILAAVSLRGGNKKKVHPATVAFQAIRMEVNQELKEIKSLLDQIPNLLKQNGRAVIISFHSGEDKLVAQTFRAWSEGDSVPAWWMGERPHSKKPIGKMLSNEAIVPGEQEVFNNPASRSARLRVFILGEH